MCISQAATTNGHKLSGLKENLLPQTWGLEAQSQASEGLCPLLGRRADSPLPHPASWDPGSLAHNSATAVPASVLTCPQQRSQGLPQARLTSSRGRCPNNICRLLFQIRARSEVPRGPLFSGGAYNSTHTPSNFRRPVLRATGPTENITSALLSLPPSEGV